MSSLSESGVGTSKVTNAGWWSRVAATLIDAVIVGFIALCVALLAGGVSLTGSETGFVATVVVGGISGFIAVLIYSPLLMARDGASNGQTVGKAALGIRVVKDDGTPFTFGSAAVRELLIKFVVFNWIGSALAGVPGIVDVLWPIWDDDNQALHDKMANTHVLTV